MPSKPRIPPRGPGAGSQSSNGARPEPVTETHWAIQYRLRGGPLTLQDWGPDGRTAREVFERPMPANVTRQVLKRRQVTYTEWTDISERKAP